MSTYDEDKAKGFRPEDDMTWQDRDNSDTVPPEFYPGRKDFGGSHEKFVDNDGSDLPVRHGYDNRALSGNDLGNNWYPGFGDVNKDGDLYDEVPAERNDGVLGAADEEDIQEEQHGRTPELEKERASRPARSRKPKASEDE